MKLFVNLDPLHPPLTGIGHYTHGVLQALLDHPRLEELAGQYLGHWHDQPAIKTLLQKSHDTGKAHPGSHIRVSGRFKRFVASIPGVRPAYRQLQQFRLNKQLHKQSLKDMVYWEPNFILRPFPGPSLTTVHDIAYIRHPEFHEQRTIERLSKQVPASLKKAAHVITVSEFSRQEIIDHYRLAEDQVSIVYPGVSGQFVPVSDERKDLVRARYALPPRFILSLGTLEPRKNLKGLMQAYRQLPHGLRQEHPLVLVGTQGWLMHQFSDDIKTLEHQGQLIRLGYVPQSDLPALISAATIMAYVSHYEGFGMPVAEAMACGTAVLTSLGTSMQEVAGDAACLVKASDPQDIARGLEALLSDDLARERHVQAGLQQVKRFTWQNAADQLLTACAQTDHFR